MHLRQLDLALYVHIPFCARHCAYCDFNVSVEPSGSPRIQATVDAIQRDIERAASHVHAGGARSVATIFFGGGTPTALSGEQLASLLDTIRACFSVRPDAEISSEANPGSSDAAKFARMREAGFNRLSIGVQAFDDRLLTALDRSHTAGEADHAFATARAAGFQNVSLDLMFGLPSQTLPLWRASLERAIALDPDHLSLYALTLEPGTRFERLYAGGKLSLPDEDDELAMYEEAITTLADAGLHHYEVSNFARPGFRSRHNQVYWRNEEYLGVGPGAVSYLGGRRWKREKLPQRYIDAVAEGRDLAVDSEQVGSGVSLAETMMLGLRLREGLEFARVRARHGVDPRAHFAAEIAALQARGLLEQGSERLVLTHQGLLLANDALTSFLPS